MQWDQAQDGSKRPSTQRDDPFVQAARARDDQRQRQREKGEGEDYLGPDASIPSGT
jgi:hypothetical protein